MNELYQITSEEIVYYSLYFWNFIGSCQINNIQSHKKIPLRGYK
jgi:hypothetical protein